MANIQILVVEDEGIIAKDIKDTLKGLVYGVPAIVSSREGAMKNANLLIRHRLAGGGEF